jgi:MarR family transcriptional repressor of emrRAB
LIQDFAYFEQGIERISRQLPGMPQDRVVLNRLFFFLFKELEEVYNRLLAEFGLNSSSFLALAMLMGCEGNRLNPCDLSDALIASRTNVTRLADELVAAGWVARNPSTADRRKVELSLTEPGRALVLQVLPKVWKLIERQWAGFSAKEVAEFDRLLRKLLGGLTHFKEEL